MATAPVPSDYRYLQYLTAIPVFGVIAHAVGELRLADIESNRSEQIRAITSVALGVGAQRASIALSGRELPASTESEIATAVRADAGTAARAKLSLIESVELRLRLKTIDAVCSFLTCIALIVLIATVLRSSPLRIKIALAIPAALLLPLAIYNVYERTQLAPALEIYRNDRDFRNLPLAFFRH